MNYATLNKQLKEKKMEIKEKNIYKNVEHSTCMYHSCMSAQ